MMHQLAGGPEVKNEEHLDWPARLLSLPYPPVLTEEEGKKKGEKLEEARFCTKGK